MTRSRSAILSAFAFVAFGALLVAQAQPPRPHPAASNPHLGNRESIRGGMGIYRLRCGDCHGLDATGYRGPDLIAALSGMPDERLFDTIRKGVPGTEMPPVSQEMIDEDILKVIAYLRGMSVAPPERAIGNVANGERLFTQQCTSCHRVAGRGGRLGPDLTRIGVQRSHAALTREIRTPSEWLGPAFETVTIVTKDGQKIRGVKKNEDVFSIQVMDTRERIQGYLKSNVEVQYDKNSLMPAFDAQRLSDSDLGDLVGYLSTLRGYDVAVR